METILLLLLGVAVIIIIVQATQKKKSPPPDVYSQATGSPNSSPPTTNHTTVNDKYTLSNSTLGDSQGAGEYEVGFDEFEVTGVHLPGRKKYILDNCSEEDLVEFIPEKNNPANPLAVAVKHKKKLIGYIADYDLDQVHELMKYEHEGIITSIDYDGDYLEMKVDLQYVIPSKKKTPKKKKKATGNTDVTPEDFMIWKSNKIPSEYLKPKQDLEDTSSYFYGKKVCISGQLSKFPYRAELAKHLWEVGADVQVNVGKTCMILISGEGVGPTKLQNAKEQGIEIMDEITLDKKLNGFKSKFI